MCSSARLLNEDAKLNITNAWTVSEFGVANITWCQLAWWLNYYRHQDKENEGVKCRFKFQSQSDKFVAKTFTRHFCLWWITGWAFGQTEGRLGKSQIPFTAWYMLNHPDKEIPESWFCAGCCVFTEKQGQPHSLNNTQSLLTEVN